MRTNSELKIICISLKADGSVGWIRKTLIKGPGLNVNLERCGMRKGWKELRSVQPLLLPLLENRGLSEGTMLNLREINERKKQTDDNIYLKLKRLRTHF